MKSKLSYRNLLLIAGIVVAMVIAFTTWVYNERTAASAERKAHKRTSHAASIIDKLIKRTDATFKF